MSDNAVLIKEIESLPPSFWGEVLDFVGFLKQKKQKNMRDESVTTIEELKRQAAEKTARRKASGIKPFEDLYGVFKDSSTFAGDPAEIVRDLRDEWNVNR